MQTLDISYEVSGRTCTGYLADGSGDGPAPGILVAHEGPGLGEHAKSRARMLADLGYVAFALDLYGERDVPLETAMTYVRQLRADRMEFRRRVRTAFDVLCGQPAVDLERLGAIGFCIGGMAVLELARSGAPVQAVVSFHGALDTPSPEDAKHIRAKILACTGADDPIVPPEQRAAFEQEMMAAGVDWQLHTYGGVGHSFTNPDADRFKMNGFAYSDAADRRSWQAMKELFEDVFGS
ncbi:MAG: dienelactone hydrolase family protein [Hyphomonas sp.]